MKHIAFSFLRRMIWTLAGLAVIICLLLYFAQDKIIFYPRNYGSDAQKFRDRYEIIQHNSENSGNQIAYYLGPGNWTIPSKIWILTGGNGSLALGWDYLTGPAFQKNPSNGYLLIEYPGYGECDGKPSRIAIQKSVKSAIETLAGHLKTDPEIVRERTAFLGHSLGAAVALETAADLERSEIIALAPFSSIKDMAKRMVGGPLSNLARHRWDNHEALSRIATYENARVLIIHGTQDEIIPVEMGRNLASAYPGAATFVEKESATHNDIGWIVRDQLIERLAR